MSRGSTDDTRPQAAESADPVVMGPHPHDLDDSLVANSVLFMWGSYDLVHEPMLQVDASRVQPREIAHERLKGRRIAKRVLPHDLDEGLRASIKPTLLQFLSVLCRLLGKHD